MRQEPFVRQHTPRWEALEAALKPLEGVRGATPPPPDTAARLPALYRAACQHLALARARAYSPRLIARLAALVARGHQQFYTRGGGALRGWLRFLLSDYPQLVRRHAAPVLAATLLLFGPMLGLTVAVLERPELVYTVLDAAELRGIESMYDPDNQARWGRKREADSDLLMFGYYIRNNTGIGFQTFAGGLTAGLLTVFFLGYNGVVLGAVEGHLIGIGHGESLYRFTAGHSGPELLAIVLSGAAGLHLGWALLAPGGRTRRLALVEAGREGVRLMYGAALLFLFAAFIEAFWSSIVSIPALVKYGVGAGIAGLLLLWLLLGGRQRT